MLPSLTPRESGGISRCSSSPLSCRRLGRGLSREPPRPGFPYALCALCPPPGRAQVARDSRPNRSRRRDQQLGLPFRDGPVGEAASVSLWKTSAGILLRWELLLEEVQAPQDRAAVVGCRPDDPSACLLALPPVLLV